MFCPVSPSPNDYNLLSCEEIEFLASKGGCDLQFYFIILQKNKSLSSSLRTKDSSKEIKPNTCTYHGHMEVTDPWQQQTPHVADWLQCSALKITMSHFYTEADLVLTV